MDYFYDAQLRKFLIQFAKIFSLCSVSRGNDSNGNPILVRVPIMYGDTSRQVAAIIANNSASHTPSAPLLTYYISGLEYDQRRTQEPTFVDKREVRQRKYDPDTQQFSTTQGQAFTVERQMPVPYNLRITLDFWSSNYQQKLEFIEQMGTLFNPGLEIQSNDNYLDWTSLSVVLQDGLTFSNKSIPQGTGNNIDILSWKFILPIWISSPIKLKKMGVIQKIIASIREGSTLYDIQDDDLLYGTRQKITPFGYNVLLLGNSLQLLPADSAFYLPNSDLNLPEPPNTNLFWSAFLNEYGVIRPGISQIWLQNPYMNTDIVGTIIVNPDDDRYLIYNIDQDTLPQNTLDPVDAVINPLLTGPNSGLNGPINRTRYLIVEDIGYENNPTISWGNLIARANDIIEYDGINQQCFVSYNSNYNNSLGNIDYVLNLTTNIQYRFSDNEWQKSYEGFYESGSFSIVI